MATYFARKNGNVNDVDVWATTPAGTAGDYFGSFTASDVLMSNGFIIQVNVGFTVDSIRNTNFDGATASGTFQLAASGLTLNCDLITGGVNNLFTNSTANRTLAINGDITGGTTGDGLIWSGSNGVITITGNILGGTSTSGFGFACSGSNSTIIIYGNVTGGSANSAWGLYITGDNSSITINGNVTGGSVNTGANGFYYSTLSSVLATITINGNVTGGTAAPGLEIISTSTNLNINIIGNISAGSGTSSVGANITQASGNTIIVGSINGHSVSSANAVNFSAGGTLTVSGAGIATGGSSSLSAIGLNITGASGGDINLFKAIGGSGVAGGPGVSCVSTRVCYIEEAEYGDLGASPTNGTIRFKDVTNNKILMYRYLSTKKALVDPVGAIDVNPEDVRDGIVYNVAVTGTMIVPPINSVLINVPVDNTLGTLQIENTQDFWNTPVSELTTTDSIGARLKNCATVSSVGKQIADCITDTIGESFEDIINTNYRNIIRLNSNSVADNDFNVGTGFDNSVTTIKVQADNKILIGGGFRSYNGVAKFALIRLNSNGTVDMPFTQGLNFPPYNIIIQPDNKIVVVGEFTLPTNRIVRLNTDGSVDNTFNVNAGASDHIYGSAIQNDEKIVCVGRFSSYQSTSCPYVVRLNSNASIDETFNIGSGFNNTTLCVAVQSNQKLIIGGYFVSYNGYATNRIVRINTDGSIDNTFNIGVGFFQPVEHISIQSDGKIICCGQFTSYNGVTQNRITRINTDGSIDNTFNVGGTGFNNRVRKTIIQPDGKIVCVGQFTSYNEVTRNGMARLNSDGSLDTSFITSTGFDNPNIMSIELQSDNKILAGGFFSSYI
jgi:uncharacterized delta-60 repeat protein